MTWIKVQPAIYQPIEVAKARARVEDIGMTTEEGGVPFSIYHEGLTTI